MECSILKKIKKMEIKRAIEIVKSFKNKSFDEIIEIEENIYDAIITVSKYSTTCRECYDVLEYIPSKLHHMGLYPHTMKKIEIPDGFDTGLIEEIENKRNEYPKELPSGDKFMKILIACGVQYDDLKNRTWYITELKPHKYHCTGYHPIQLRMDIIKENIVV